MMMVSSLLNIRSRMLQKLMRSLRRLQLIIMMWFLMFSMRLQVAIMGRWMLLLNPDRSD